MEDFAKLSSKLDLNSLKKMTKREFFKEHIKYIGMNSIPLIINDRRWLADYIDENGEDILNEYDEKFFQENMDKIDEDKAIYMIATYFLNIINSSENKFLKKGVEIYFNQALKYIEKTDVEILCIGEKDGKSIIKYDVDINDLLNRPKKEKTKLKEENIQFFEDIKKDIKLENLFWADPYFNDLKEFGYYYKGNSDFINCLIFDNVARIFRKQDAEKNFNEKESKELYRGIVLKEFENIIKDYPEKIDVKKLFLATALRAKKMLESDVNYSEDIRKNCIFVMKILNEHLKDYRVKIYGNMVLSEEGKTQYVEYSSKELASDVSRIVDYDYYSKSDLISMKREILNGEMDFNEIKYRKLVDLLQFSETEKKKIIDINPQSLEKMLKYDMFTKNGEIEKDKVLEIINSHDDCKFNLILLDDLYRKNIVDEKSIVEMYTRNNIEFDTMLDMCWLRDFSDAINSKDLLNLYCAISDSENEEEKSKNTKKFERYSKLFNELYIKNQPLEVQQEAAEKIIEELYTKDRDYIEDFKNLYKYDLLPIRTVSEWNGENIVYDLFSNNNLKPRDAKSLLMSDELDLEKMRESIENSKLSDMEKMKLIFSSFDGFGQNEEEILRQKEAREYLIQSLNVSNVREYSNKSEKTRNINITENEGAKREKRIINPSLRWRLLSEIDQDYSSDMYTDGTVVVNLPNIKNGTVVIEKFYKNTKNGIKPDYGVATYIMSQEEFINQKSNIVERGKIKRKALVDLAKQNLASKIEHVPTWGKNLKNNLEVTQGRSYSEEKINVIDNLIEQMKTERELIR